MNLSELELPTSEEDMTVFVLLDKDISVYREISMFVLKNARDRSDLKHENQIKRYFLIWLRFNLWAIENVYKDHMFMWLEFSNNHIIHKTNRRKTSFKILNSFAEEASALTDKWQKHAASAISQQNKP